MRPPALKNQGFGHFASFLGRKNNLKNKRLCVCDGSVTGSIARQPNAGAAVEFSSRKVIGIAIGMGMGMGLARV